MGLLSGAIMKHNAEWGESHSKSLMEVQQYVNDHLVGPSIYGTKPPAEGQEDNG